MRQNAAGGRNEGGRAIFPVRRETKPLTPSLLIWLLWSPVPESVGEPGLLSRMKIGISPPSTKFPLQMPLVSPHSLSRCRAEDISPRRLIPGFPRNCILQGGWSLQNSPGNIFPCSLPSLHLSCRYTLVKDSFHASFLGAHHFPGTVPSYMGWSWQQHPHYPSLTDGGWKRPLKLMLAHLCLTLVKVGKQRREGERGTVSRKPHSPFLCHQVGSTSMMKQCSTWCEAFISLLLMNSVWLHSQYPAQKREVSPRKCSVPVRSSWKLKQLPRIK